MNILFSVSYSKNLEVPAGLVDGHQVTVVPRASDWGVSGARKYLHYTREAVRIMRRARHFDSLVLCSVGIEAMLIAQWRRVLCPRTQVVCYDFLMPRESKAVLWMQPWLKRLDVFACIRTGDIAVLKRRFGVPAAKCHFVPFPIPADLEQVATEEGDYIYSAGWAHRDWDTLMRALATLPYQAVLSSGVKLEVPPHAAERIRVLPMQNHSQGRQWMAKARLAVLAFKDTELPSGPLVLLDAMAMGKPVVATSVNGTRDYVRDGETALLAAPGDSEALAMAIRRAMEDDALRRDLGRAAQADVCERFTMSQFLHQIVALCATLNRK